MREVAGGIPILPSILESEQYKKAIDQGKTLFESEPRCCSGKGKTINLTLGFRCCLTIAEQSTIQILSNLERVN
jgi:hypothetical protein